LAKAIEKVEKKVTRAQEAEERAAAEAAGHPEYSVIPMLELLLDQNMHKPAGVGTSWSYFGPAEALLQMLVEKNGGKAGLPADGEQLLRFLQTPAINRTMRREHLIWCTFPPAPQSSRYEASVPMLRIERVTNPDEFRGWNF
jgi:hypothetical protein